MILNPVSDERSDLVSPHRDPNVLRIISAFEVEENHVSSDFGDLAHITVEANIHRRNKFRFINGSSSIGLTWMVPISSQD